MNRLRTAAQKTVPAIALVCVLTAMLSGCMGNDYKAPSFHLLTARAPAGTAIVNLTVGVGPVRVAPFLKQPQLVTHAGSGALAVAESQRWSEPLEQGIQRVLLQNLTALTGADTRNFPWTQTTIPQYALRVDVIDLDRAADGNALLEVNWMLEDIALNKLVVSRRERLTAPIAAGANPDAALTAAYSELLAQLAQHMADALAQQPATAQNPSESPRPSQQ
jgi:uncharacterized lipoprotein YmbA